jgi:RNA-directed DNA polymerase
VPACSGASADKSAVARPEERHFLGFRLRSDPELGTIEVLLSKRSKERVDEKIRKLVSRFWGQSLRDCIRRVNPYVLGWIGFFWPCTEGERQTMEALDARIRRRLRALLLKHWKQKRFIVRKLIELGAKARTARKTVYESNGSWWALSHASVVDRALRKIYFAERGLVSIEQRWLELQRDNIGPAQLTLGLG